MLNPALLGLRKKILLSLILSVFFLFVFNLFNTGFVLAQEDVIKNNTKSTDTFGIQPVEQNIALSGTDLRLVVFKIIRVVLGLVGIILVVLIIYAGYLIMLSGGNEEKIGQGKKILINATIGLAIILASVTIVQFIINALTGNLNPGNGNQGVNGPQFNTFAGSGSLGKVVKDHYPFRDQTGVKRNSKIAITFYPAIDPSSFIQNTNNTCWPEDGSGIPTTNCKKDPKTNQIINPYYGDCLKKDLALDWEKDCDLLKTNSIEIYKLKNDKGKNNIAQKDGDNLQAAVMVTYEKGEVYTIVLKPLKYLGDDNNNYWYRVDLLNQIKRSNDGLGIFTGRSKLNYPWEFQTDTTFDFEPPYVVSTYPKEEQSIARNTILQMNFNESMDPIMVQGELNKDGSFSNIIFNNQDVKGIWRITNSYKTVEFVSDEPCGQNSCGDIMYCLPVSCADKNDPSCKNNYTGLARTADLLKEGQTSFEAVPFSGVMDMAGNAMYYGTLEELSVKNKKPHNPHKPSIGNPKIIGDGKNGTANEKAPDNFWWNFVVENKIDRSVPYIESFSPTMDAEEVVSDAPLKIYFSKPMWYGTLSKVKLEEYPANINKLDEIWFKHEAEQKNDKTVLNILHREFGPNNLELYYYPIVTSTVMSLNQNCLYPGRGPDAETKNTLPEPQCYYKEDAEGNFVSSKNCIPVDKNFTSSTDTGCLTSDGVAVSKLQGDVESCIKKIKTISPYNAP